MKYWSACPAPQPELKGMGEKRIRCICSSSKDKRSVVVQNCKSQSTIAAAGTVTLLSKIG